MNKISEKDIQDAIDFNQQLHYTISDAPIRSDGFEFGINTPAIATFHQWPAPMHLTLCGSNGNQIAINLDTGEVKYTGDVNEAAKDFWRAVELMYPYYKENK